MPGAVPETRCGGCTLCCKLLEVEPLGKAAGQDCPSCTPTGCSVWRFRPAICRGFVCLWYANPKFPTALRPDHCGVFFEPGGERVMLAGARPGEWRGGIAWAFIQKCLIEGTAVIVQEPAGGGKTIKHFLMPDGDTPEGLWARTSEDARRRGFVADSRPTPRPTPCSDTRPRWRDGWSEVWTNKDWVLWSKGDWNLYEFPDGYCSLSLNQVWLSDGVYHSWDAAVARVEGG